MMNVAIAWRRMAGIIKDPARGKEGAMSLPLTLDDRHNSALLNSRRALETVGIDTLTLVSLELPHAQHFRLGTPRARIFFCSYLEAARTSGSSHRKNRRSHRSWTRSGLYGHMAVSYVLALWKVIDRFGR